MHGASRGYGAEKAMNETVEILCQLWEGDLSRDFAKQAMQEDCPLALLTQ